MVEIIQHIEFNFPIFFSLKIMMRVFYISVKFFINIHAAIIEYLIWMIESIAVHSFISSINFLCWKSRCHWYFFQQWFQISCISHFFEGLRRSVDPLRKRLYAHPQKISRSPEDYLWIPYRTRKLGLWSPIFFSINFLSNMRKVKGRINSSVEMSITCWSQWNLMISVCCVVYYYQSLDTLRPCLLHNWEVPRFSLVNSHFCLRDFYPSVWYCILKLNSTATVPNKHP